MIKFYVEKPVVLKNKKQLKIFIESIFKAEKTVLDSLNYIFCSDEYLLSINLEFLKHDYYTDIITFDLTEKGIKGKTAEIYISVDRVKEYAREHRVTINSELHRVIFHGALHLCGYKDKTPGQIKEMRSKENYYLVRYNPK